MVERFAKQRDHQKNSDVYVTFPSSCETVNKGNHVTGIDDIKNFSENSGIILQLRRVSFTRSICSLVCLTRQHLEGTGHCSQMH